MAQPSSSRGGYLQPRDASPSFAQTTAEFNLDSDLDLSDLEAELGGGEAYMLRSVENGPARGRGGGGGGDGLDNNKVFGDDDDDYDDEDEEDEEDSDGWIRTGSASHRRRGSVSTVASFQLYTPDEERAVVKKFDRKLVLFVALLYMLSFLDRSNIGNARISGMDEDLQTSPPWDGWYEWALTAFYISYIAFEWMSLMWKLVPAHIYVSMLVLSWGVLASLQAVSVSYPMLIALRALLGIGEAGFTGIPFYLSFFFKRDELAFRTAIFISAAPLATSFASSLAWVIVKAGESSPIAPWRLLFLIEGFPSVLVSIIAWRIIPDSPQTARYLTSRERKVAQLRLRNERLPHDSPASKEDRHHVSSSSFSSRRQGTTVATGIRGRELLAVLADPLAWLAAAIFFLTNLAYSSLPVFLPKILIDMGHDRLSAQALSAPPYLLAFVVVLLTARLSDRARDRSFPMAVHALASAAGYAVLAFAEPLSLPPGVRYAAVYPAAVGFFNVITLLLAWGINNQASESRQGGGFALMQLVGQCGPLVGTRLYPERHAPFYAPGMRVCAGAMLAVAVLAGVMRGYVRWRNRRMDKRDAERGAGVVDTGAEVRAEEEEGLVAAEGEEGRGGRTVEERFRYMV